MHSHHMAIEAWCEENMSERPAKVSEWATHDDIVQVFIKLSQSVLIDQSIRRSIFMGDYVYAISAAGVTATHLETLVETARIAIPHESQYTTEPIVSEESREDDATVDADSDRA